MKFSVKSRFVCAVCFPAAQRSAAPIAEADIRRNSDGGKLLSGGTIAAAAPIETEPLFVRDGSIVPQGPAIQYAMQTNNPIELRAYPGADGAFTLWMTKATITITANQN